MSNSKAAREVAAPTIESQSIAALIAAINARRSYPGTQQNLYSYAKLCWENYETKQSDFTAFSAMYTPELGEDALAAIEAAEAMPSFEALRAMHSVARNDLIKMTQPLQNNWFKLKGYMAVAYDATTRPAMLEAAGAGYYSAIDRGSWDGVETFIRMVNTFLTMHSAELLANNNMPASFPTTFSNAGAAFSAQRNLFLLKEKTAKEGVLAKYNANESIYASLATMAEAGRAIFRAQPLERSYFTISSLLRDVRGNSPSGIKGVVTTGSLPTMPVANVVVYDRNDPSRSALTQADGSYELRIPSGVQLIRVEAEGFVPQDFERKISVGTMHRMSFSLEPLAADTAPLADASSNGHAVYLPNNDAIAAGEL